MGMFNKTCKETSVLVTQSMDRKLGWTERISLKIHLKVCDNCARFVRQMHLLRSWVSSEDESNQPGLPEEGRQRIANKLKEGD